MNDKRAFKLSELMMTYIVILYIEPFLLKTIILFHNDAFGIQLDISGKQSVLRYKVIDNNLSLCENSYKSFNRHIQNVCHQKKFILVSRCSLIKTHLFIYIVYRNIYS